mgnify:CR=1 FL=1
MVSTSKAIIVSQEKGVNQGDVFKDVKYSFIDSEDNESIDIIEYTFPYAIVVSQSCDVAFMDGFESGAHSAPVKYMPSILMCPIYSKDLIAHGEHLKEIFEDINRTLINGAPYYNKDDSRTTEKDQHVRFHALKVNVNDKTIIDNMVIDFKHIFSVPMKYLRNNRDNRICSIEDIYIDQIVNKMAAYLSRIGLPDPKINKNDEKQ